MPALSLIAATAGELRLGAIPLEAKVLFIGIVYLGTLMISHFSVRIGIPAILGVLLMGLAINVHSLNVSHTEVQNLYVFALALLLFYAGLKTDLQAIRGFLRYGLMLAIGGVATATLVLGISIWWLSSESGASLAPGQVNAMPIGAALLIATCLRRGGRACVVLPRSMLAVASVEPVRRQVTATADLESV